MILIYCPWNSKHEKARNLKTLENLFLFVCFNVYSNSKLYHYWWISIFCFIFQRIAFYYTIGNQYLKHKYNNTWSISYKFSITFTVCWILLTIFYDFCSLKQLRYFSIFCLLSPRKLVTYHCSASYM